MVKFNIGTESLLSCVWARIRDPVIQIMKLFKIFGIILRAFAKGHSPSCCFNLAANASGY